MPTRLIRIVAVEQQRFQSSDDYDEMRVLNIRLLPLQGAVSLRPDLVDVIVDFFDEDTATRRVGKARAIVPPSVVRPSGPWVDGEEKAVMASYVVPRGARAREAALGRHEQFHGYVVSVVCRGVTNDIDARPRTLAPLLPSTGAGTESADVSLHRGEGPLRTTER
jgi:hypothetical protein